MPPCDTGLHRVKLQHASRLQRAHVDYAFIVGGNVLNGRINTNIYTVVLKYTREREGAPLSLQDNAIRRVAAD